VKWFEQRTKEGAGEWFLVFSVYTGRCATWNRHLFLVGALVEVHVTVVDWL